MARRAGPLRWRTWIMEQLGARAAQTRRRLRSSSSEVISLGYHLCGLPSSTRPLWDAHVASWSISRPPDGNCKRHLIKGSVSRTTSLKLFKLDSTAIDLPYPSSWTTTTATICSFFLWFSNLGTGVCRGGDFASCRICGAASPRSLWPRQQVLVLTFVTTPGGKTPQATDA